MPLINRVRLTYLIIAIVVLFVFVLVNPAFTGFVVLASAEVDEEVLEELEEKDFADVIIVLDEPEDYELKSEKNGGKKIEIKKEKIRKVQEEVLESVSYEKGNRTINRAKNLITGLFVSEDEKPDLKLKHRYSTVSAISGNISKGGLEKLKRNPNVKRIIKNREFELFLDESRDVVNATAVHGIQVSGMNITGVGETICVIDSGVNYQHESLGGCTNETFLAGNCSKVIAGYDFYSDDNDPMDENGHGTHVAGIVAGNGTVKGMAPGATITALRVCGAGCPLADIIAGIDWCTANASNFNISVITMSLGGGLYDSECDDSYNETFSPSINNANDLGIFVVAASGNDAQINNISAPACIQNCTSVGATYDADVGSVGYSSCSDTTSAVDQVACFTNMAPILDTLAPGAIITSAKDDSGVSDKAGTSMAAPHLAGAAALLRQYSRLVNNADLTPGEVKTLLVNGGKSISVLNYTFPRLDILASINLIMNINETDNSVSDRNGNVKIKFNGSVNLSSASTSFIVGKNFIGLNSTKYSSLNISANITFYSLSFNKTPIILKDGNECQDCSVISYEDNNLTFSVTGFSNYTAGENSQLNIFDDVDNGTIRYTRENVSFFANYTNRSSGAPISTATCNISFSDGNSGLMNYDNNLFRYIRNFTIADLYFYNVTCNDTGFETLNLSDDITVLPGCGLPPPNIDWNITGNVTVACENENLYFQNQTLTVGPNATFILNLSSLILDEASSPKDIIINESAFLTISDSYVIGKANRFNIKTYGVNNLYNLTTNNSQVYLSGNKPNIVTGSNFYFTLTLNENSSNEVYNSTFFGNLELNDNSSNKIENVIIWQDLIISEDSNNSISNVIINQTLQTSGNALTRSYNITLRILDIYENSEINFESPQSNITDEMVWRQFSKPIMRGHVDMPDVITIAFGTPGLNRYYPVYVNYTNGTPVANRTINISNGTDILFSGVSDNNGIINPNLTWNGSNKDDSYNISVNPQQDIGLLTDTPIIFLLNVPPEVNLEKPDNNSVIVSADNETPVTFNFTVTDDNLTLNCSIYIDGILNKTNQSVQNNTLTEFVINVTGGYHSWLVNCSDGEYATASETRNFSVQYCGDNIALGTEDCDGSDLKGESCASLGYDSGILSCSASCTYEGCYNSGGSSGGGSGGGGGSSPVIPPQQKNNESPEEADEEEEVVVKEVVEATRREESNKRVTSVLESPQPLTANGNNEATSRRVMLWGLIPLVLLATFLPIFFLGRRTFAKDEAVKKLLDRDRINDYRRLYVTKDVMEKYKKVFADKDRPHELLPIYLSRKDFRKVVEVKDEFRIDEELAKLVVAANKKLWPRVLVVKDAPEKLRKHFKKIKFEQV